MLNLYKSTQDGLLMDDLYFPEFISSFLQNPRYPFQ
jgi:hypothetical protein